MSGGQFVLGDGKPRHRCDAPRVNDLQFGTLWRCDDCGTYWEVCPPGFGTISATVGYREWRRPSKRRLKRLLRKVAPDGR